MSPQAMTELGYGWMRTLPPNEYLRYVEASKREAKCRACGAPIPKGTKHLCFRFRDGAWRRSFRLCNPCLAKIVMEAERNVEKKGKRKDATRPVAREGSPSLINIALPSAEFFDSLRSEIEAHREARETARARGREAASWKAIRR